MIFLGGIRSVHNFYLGYTGKAITQLVLTIVGYILCCVVVGVFLVIGIWIWSLVEAIMILTGKINVDGKDYYLNAVGKVAKNQWVGDYYLDENGNVVKNSWAGSYWCGEDGKYVINTFTPDEYYCGSDGVYVRNRWIKVDGKDYYMNGYGKMAKNTWSGAYYLGADGVMNF